MNRLTGIVGPLFFLAALALVVYQPQVAKYLEQPQPATPVGPMEVVVEQGSGLIPINQQHRLQVQPGPDGALHVIGSDVAGKPLHAGQGAMIRERVIELPEDGNRWQTIVVYATPDRRDQASAALSNAFASDPRLQSLKGQTTFWEYALGDGSKVSQSWIRSQLGGSPLPAVIVQYPLVGNPGVAKVVYKATGNNLPSLSMLPVEIQASIDSSCPGPSPNNPPPNQPVNPNNIPDTRPSIPTPVLPQGNTSLVTIIVAVIAALAAMYRNIKAP